MWPEMFRKTTLTRGVRVGLTKIVRNAQVPDNHCQPSQPYLHEWSVSDPKLPVFTNAPLAIGESPAPLNRSS